MCLTVPGTSDRFGSPAGSDWLPAGGVDQATYRVPEALSRLRRATSPVQRAIRASPGSRIEKNLGRQARDIQKVKELAARGVERYRECLCPMFRAVPVVSPYGMG